jgi:hypothetical protein
MARVDLDGPEGCWLWQGATNGAGTPPGYGVVSFGGKRQYAHRLLYEVAVGEIPDGLEIDHLCKVTNCVNPDHLEPVTHGENLRRGEMNRQEHKTHCPKGHRYDEDNTYRWGGARRCRACNREAVRQYRERQHV